MYLMLRRILVIFFIASVTSPITLCAQNYPSKPIRLIVPFPAGGGVDVIARIIGPKLSESLGHQVIVDNRAGGGTIIGTEALAKSPPDGYTMMIANSAFGANPALHAKLPYDTVRDFAPVSLVVMFPCILAVHPSFPARNVGELIGLAKATPGKLSYASAGTGSYIHLAMELFKSVAGVSIVHVPYKGANLALNDLLGGQIPMMFVTGQLGIPYIKAGRLRALAVTSAKPMPLLPDVPTVAQSGYPGFELDDWEGIIVPAGTPTPIVARLNAEINQIVSSAEVRARMSGLGATPAGSTPGQLGERIKTELAKWATVVKEAGIVVD